MNKTPKRQTFEEWGCKHLSQEFLKKCDDEHRRMEIVGSKHDREWADHRLPGWKFFRSNYCETTFVGSNTGLGTLGLTVQGSSESEVQEAAAEAEQLLAEDTTD